MSSRRARRSFAVIGLGRFGGTIATELARFDNRVLGVDLDEATVARFAGTLADVVIADGRSEEALREAGVAGYDVAVVGIGESLEGSIVCTMNCRLLGIETIWVKAQNRTHHRILTKIGADRVVEAEREFGEHVAQMLHNPVIRDYVSLGNGFHAYVVIVPERLAGQALGRLGLAGHDLKCLSLMRGGKHLPVDEEAAIKKDDRLLLLGKRADLRAFADVC